MRLSTPRRLLALPLLVLLAGSAQAQTAILTESFANATFPPAGWAITNNGVGTTQSWARVTSTNASLTPAYARSRFEDVTDGTFAIDNLVTPLVAIPAGGAVVRYKQFESNGTDFGSVYRVLVSTTSQTDPAAFTQVAQYSEGVACPGNTGTASTSTTIPTARNCAVTLPALYSGQSVYIAFQHQNDDGDSFNLDDVLVETAPTTPTFTLSPTTAAAFGTATACSFRPGTEQVFTVTNTGVGTLTVSGVTVTGSAFTSASLFPAALTAGQSRSFIVRFAPPVGATAGPQTGSFTVQYDAGSGTTSSAAVALTGTIGTDANTSAGAGEGYRWATSNAACQPGGVSPTAFTPIPFGTAAGDTQVPGFFQTNGTTADDDDGSFRVDLAATAFGSFRFYGKTYTQLFINSNGSVYFDAPSASFNVGPTTSPVTFPAAPTGTITYNTGDAEPRRNAAIHAVSDDFVPVTGATSVFYRVQDITGPGGVPDGTPEFIITYYRLPYFSATGAYLTFQVVLGKSQSASGNGIVAIQYYGGINPADGQPYTLNPGVAGAANPDALVGLTGDQGFMSTLYRDNASATSGPLYGGGDLTVFFGPRGEQILGQTYAGAGYRQLSHGPGAAMNVADLAEQNLVQGVTDEYNAGDDNLLTEYDFGTTTTDPPGYASPAARTTALTPGKGMFWYFFDATFNPSASTASGVGSSESFALPNPLLAAGTVQTGPVTTPVDATADGVFRYEMLGNPFEGSFDVTTMTSTGTTGTLSAAAQTYNPTSPSTGTYVPASLSGNRVALWQGFFLDVGAGTTAVTFPITGVSQTSTPFYGFGEDAPQEQAATVSERLLAFELSGSTPAGDPTLDQAAVVYFREGAEDGWDRFDAGKLTPFGPYAVLAAVGDREGQSVLKAQESRPYDAASFDVPLVVEAVGTNPALTLRWDRMDNVPAEWTLTLRDVVTGTVVDLRTATEYAFEVAPSAAAPTPTSVLMPPSPTALAVDAARGTATERFVLHVQTGNVVATDPGVPTVFALAAPAPNPTSSSATVAFDVPEATDVSVTVYDLLGRRVAVLAEGQVAPGRHTARIEAGTFAPGVYVVRMEAGTFSATQRVTVVR